MCHVPVSSVFVPPSSRRLPPSSLCPSSCSRHRPERDECAPMPLQPAPSPSLFASPASPRLPPRTTSAVTAERAAAAGNAYRPPLHPPSLPLHRSRSFLLPASHTSLGWAEAERMRGVAGLSHFCMRAGTRPSCADESCRALSLHCVSHFSYLRHASCLIAGFVLSLQLSLIHLSSSSSSAEREINLLFHIWWRIWVVISHPTTLVRSAPRDCWSFLPSLHLLSCRCFDWILSFAVISPTSCRNAELPAAVAL
jgi:hypothetical protein